MSNVFISFLGTGSYCKCNYTLKGETVRGVHYIQEALLHLLSTDFTQSDRALIFTTKEAEAKNWKGKLEKKLSPFRERFSVKNISVPDGKTEEEIWKIFNTVFDELNEGDKVLLDITHGFRSLPMLSIVLLNYARFLKRVDVAGIYYGAFEALGSRIEVDKMSLSQRNAPVFDLTSFDAIQQWGFAAENFVNYGNAEKISELLQKSIPERKPENQMFVKMKKIKNLRGRLSDFSRLFSTVRGPEILEGDCFTELARLLEDIPGILSEYNDFFSKTINPILPVLEKVEEKLAPFGKARVANGLNGVMWCLDHRLTQQGITLLQEVIITVILETEKIDSLKYENRQFVSDHISFIEKIRKGKKVKRCKESIDNEAADKIKGSIILNSLALCYDSLRKDRNNINHAGFTKEKMEGKKFREHLEKTFLKVERIISAGGAETL